MMSGLRVFHIDATTMQSVAMLHLMECLQLTDICRNVLIKLHNRVLRKMHANCTHTIVVIVCLPACSCMNNSIMTITSYYKGFEVRAFLGENH